MWLPQFMRGSGEAQQPLNVHETIQRALDQRSNCGSNFSFRIALAELLVTRAMTDADLKETLECLKLAADKDGEGRATTANLRTYKNYRRDSEISEAIYQSRLKQLVELDPRYAWQALNADPANFCAWIDVLVKSYFAKELTRGQLAMLSLVLDGSGDKASVLNWGKNDHNEPDSVTTSSFQAAVAVVSKALPGFDVDHIQSSSITNPDRTVYSFKAVYDPHSRSPRPCSGG